jgi:hypothetical protein
MLTSLSTAMREDWPPGPEAAVRALAVDALTHFYSALADVGRREEYALVCGWAWRVREACASTGDMARWRELCLGVAGGPT